ncbi:MAG: hypothetical protein AAB348_03055 [Patescibacteria group bacterium]
MGGLPSEKQLKKRQKDAEKKLRELRTAHDEFVAAWEKIFKDERVAMSQLKSQLDKKKIKNILKTIENK